MLETIPFDIGTLDQAKGCPHTDRARKQSCDHCSSVLCYECFFEDVIRKRTQAVSSVDTITGFSHGSFCASCFLKRVQAPGYKIHFRGTMTPDSTMKPIKPSYFRSTHTSIDFLYMFFFVMTTPLAFFGPIFYTTQFMRAKKAYENFEHNLYQAINIIRQLSSESGTK